MTSKHTLHNKRVLITGASRGVGEVLARAFAGAGATVALVARTTDAIDLLAGQLGGTAHTADLSDPADISTLIDRIERRAGPIDVLVNNAGIEDTASFTELTNERLRMVTEVNYIAPAELCRQAIPRMLERGGGHIVNISSMAACVPFPGIASYAASKAALSQFTAALRADLRGLPIHTTLVENGPIPTELLAHLKKYRPTALSFERSARTRLVVDVPRERVARHIVRAVDRNRRYVRLPLRAAAFPLIADVPRRVTEIVLTGIPHQDPR